MFCQEIFSWHCQLSFQSSIILRHPGILPAGTLNFKALGVVLLSDLLTINPGRITQPDGVSSPGLVEEPMVSRDTPTCGSRRGVATQESSRYVKLTSCYLFPKSNRRWTSIRMAVIKKIKDKRWRGCGEWGTARPPTLLVGMKVGAVTAEKRPRSPK